MNENISKKARNEYHNKWQKQNRDKVRKAQERYWLKKALKNQKKR